MEAAAKALGISEPSSSSSSATAGRWRQIAKAQGKDFADVKAAIRAAVKTELDAAVKDGRLTQAQADDMLEHLTAPSTTSAVRSAATATAGPGPIPGPPRGGARPAGHPYACTASCSPSGPAVRSGACCARSRTRSSAAG